MRGGKIATKKLLVISHQLSETTTSCRTQVVEEGGNGAFVRLSEN
jgi:hypothetical protein